MNAMEASKLAPVDHLHAFHICRGKDDKGEEHEVRTLIDFSIIQKSKTHQWHASHIYGCSSLDDNAAGPAKRSGLIVVEDTSILEIALNFSHDTPPPFRKSCYIVAQVFIDGETAPSAERLFALPTLGTPQVPELLLIDGLLHKRADDEGLYRKPFILKTRWPSPLELDALAASASRDAVDDFSSIRVVLRDALVKEITENRVMDLRSPHTHLPIELCPEQGSHPRLSHGIALGRSIPATRKHWNYIPQHSGPKLQAVFAEFKIQYKSQDVIQRLAQVDNSPFLVVDKGIAAQVIARKIEEEKDNEQDDEKRQLRSSDIDLLPPLLVESGTGAKRKAERGRMEEWWPTPVEKGSSDPQASSTTSQKRNASPTKSASTANKKFRVTFGVDEKPTLSSRSSSARNQDVVRVKVEADEPAVNAPEPVVPAVVGALVAAAIPAPQGGVGNMFPEVTRPAAPHIANLGTYSIKDVALRNSAAATAWLESVGLYHEDNLNTLLYFGFKSVAHFRQFYNAMPPAQQRAVYMELGCALGAYARDLLLRQDS